jgi:hypothetical protein
MQSSIFVHLKNAYFTVQSVERVFEKIKPLLEKSGAEIVKKVGYVYHF